MKTVARLSAEDRSDLFRNTANRMQMSDAIVEKDPVYDEYILKNTIDPSSWDDDYVVPAGSITTTDLNSFDHRKRQFFSLTRKAKGTSG